MKIRLAELDDLRAIVAIYNQAVANGHSTGDTEPLDINNQIEWYENHLQDNTPIFVADSGSKVLGYNALSKYRNGRQAFRHTLETSYYIDAGHQRRGIASALMNKVEETCAGEGVRTLICYVLEHNEASRLFLEKHGFHQWGLLPDVADFAGIEYNHIIFGKRIGDNHEK